MISNGARDYLAAAKTLQENPLTASHPYWFCIFQSIELSLKAFLRGKGLSKEQLKKRELGHRLRALTIWPRRVAYVRSRASRKKKRSLSAMLVRCTARRYFSIRRQDGRAYLMRTRAMQWLRRYSMRFDLLQKRKELCIMTNRQQYGEAPNRVPGTDLLSQPGATTTRRLSHICHSDSVTGDLHPIYSAPMLGTHKSFHLTFFCFAPKCR